MGFVKVDCNKEKNIIMNKDNEIKMYINEFEKEYELMQSIVEMRKKQGLTQKDISKRSGLTQQMVSRMEKVNNSPTLINFLKYINALGLDLKVLEKTN